MLLEVSPALSALTSGRSETLICDLRYEKTSEMHPISASLLY